MNETAISDNETKDPGPWLPRWNGAAYAENNAHHRQHDEAFLAAFPARPTDHLLDIGCGSGEFTARLASLVPDGSVTGLDPQPSMLVEARRIAAPNQTFVEARAQDLAAALAADERFDGIVSRAALHWAPADDQLGILLAAHGRLRPGGWLRIEMGGVGNIARICSVVGEISARHDGPTPPWTFPAPGESLDLLERAGFELGAGHVRAVAQRRPLTRETLLGWLRSQCVEAFRPGMPAEAFGPFCAEVEERVDELRRRDGTYDQTFVRLDVLAYGRAA